MIVGIRCWSCGKPIAHLWEKFKEQSSKSENMKEALDELGLERYCCRQMLMGNVELIDIAGQFKKF